MAAQTTQRMLTAGTIAGWHVLIVGDAICYGSDADLLAGQSHRHQVPNYGTGISDLAARPGFRLGWVRMEDDAEILYFYDRDDDGFGYALNTSDPQLSEWGYSPFARDGAA